MTYRWFFGEQGSGLYFKIEFDGINFTVTMLEGAMDLNALWISNGDTTKDTNWSLPKKSSSLNMDDTEVVWDNFALLSQTGLKKGKNLGSKDTYITTSKTYTITLTNLKTYFWDAFVDGSTDWSSITLGVRATSVSGLTETTSIKYVARAEEMCTLPDGWDIADIKTMHYIGRDQRGGIAQVVTEDFFTAVWHSSLDLVTGNIQSNAYFSGTDYTLDDPFGIVRAAEWAMATVIGNTAENRNASNGYFNNVGMPEGTFKWAITDTSSNQTYLLECFNKDQSDNVWGPNPAVYLDTAKLIGVLDSACTNEIFYPNSLIG